jgi:hypothetical protein
MPSLSTWRIGFPPPPVASGHQSRSHRYLDLEVEVDDEDEDEDEFVEDDTEADEEESEYIEPAMASRQAKVTSTGLLSATFRIPGRSNIPSDKGSHKVVITVLKLAAEVEWVCVPREKETVFLRVSLSTRGCSGRQ